MFSNPFEVIENTVMFIVKNEKSSNPKFLFVLDIVIILPFGNFYINSRY